MILGVPFGTRLELRLEVGNVVVAKDLLLALSAADALDHRRVVLLVREDDRAGNELDERRERGVVGNVGRGEEKGRFLAMQVGQLAFQLHVVVGRAGDIARAAGAGAHGVDRLVHGGQYRRVLAHAEIVVGAPHGDLARTVRREVICHRKEPAAALHIREGAISAFAMKGLEPLLEQPLEIHVGLLHVCPANRGYAHSAFRPSSIAAAVILPDAAWSSLKISSALRNAFAATSL